MSKLTCTVLAVLLVVGAAGCGSATGGSALRPPVSAKWVGPPIPGPGGGTVETTIYYGPWSCNAKLMASCQRRCAASGRMLMGCIWLADVKGDWRGRFLSLPAEAGTRLPLHHCCCDYPELPPGQTELLRKTWENARRSFRKTWGEEFGAWPKTGGDNWPGHHIFDLLHGGAPTTPGNVLPVPPDVHEVINKAYPACYANDGKWRAIGPDLPYSD
jgi:hypothetical protein